MISKDTAFMTLQEFTDYAKEWVSSVNNEYKGHNLIFTIDDLLGTISARELCEECHGVKEPFQYLDIPVDISFEDKADVEVILEEALYFGTDFDDCDCRQDGELRERTQESNSTQVDNEMGQCAFCATRLPVSQMIKVGSNKYICVDDFVDEIVCSLSDAEMGTALDLLTKAIVSNNSNETIIEAMPDVIEQKVYGGAPAVANYNKQDFFKSIVERKYDLNDTAALIDDLVALTIIAGKLDIYWEEFPDLKRMLP